MKAYVAIGAAIALAVSTGASAAKPPPKRAEAFDALIACRAIADPAEKFACLDRTSAALESAAARGDIVVVDRKQITETKRTLFGFDLPKLSLFGGGVDRPEDDVKTVEGTIASAHTDGDGRWIVRLQDGALWRQIDSNTLGRSPKPGNKVVINRNMIGSYSMRVGGQPGIKVRRSN